jgi:hypothetical protein
MSYRTLLATASVTATLSLMAMAPAQAAFFHVGSGSIDGSLCVGNDCVASESFGFDTIRIKENNLRIHFDDTSVAASFPRNDWRLIANDSANGGASKFSIEDSTAGRTVFTVLAGARTNALFVDAQGDLGLGTSTPATDIDIKTGDTPTVRLQQDTSSGFAAQTWDMAGNETSFFIRDASSGSTLPFRIMGGGAPSNALVIANDGNIGIGTTSPDNQLHIKESSGDVVMRMEASTTTGSAVFKLQDGGGLDELRISLTSTPDLEFKLDENGNLTLSGDLITGGSGNCASPNPPCDAVFDSDIYTVRPIEEHAALMWENKYLPAVGPTGPGQQVNVADKMLRMLNELEHAHIYIEQLNSRLAVLEEQIKAN